MVPATDARSSSRCCASGGEGRQIEASITVRQEAEALRAAIRRIHLEAFGRSAEADLVEALRLSAEFVPELALVAEQEGEVVGHVVFSRVAIGAAPDRAVGLGPIAVQPMFQRRGIGGRMIRAGLEESAALGFDAVILIGHPTYYPRFGFMPGSRFRLRTTYDVPDDVFMALLLRSEGGDDLAGEVRYSPAFAGV